MPKRFSATESAIEKGLETIKPDAAVKLIEGWEQELESADLSGVKGIAGDLERLKKELSKESPKPEAVTKLVGKLGAATTKAAERADGPVADKVRSLGEALSNSGTADDGEEDAGEDDGGKAK